MNDLQQKSRPENPDPTTCRDGTIWPPGWNTRRVASDLVGNAPGNPNREFRRRTKTPASFGTETAAVTVLFELVALGHIALRKVDGHQELPSFLAKEWSQAA